MTVDVCVNSLPLILQGSGCFMLSSDLPDSFSSVLGYCRLPVAAAVHGFAVQECSLFGFVCRFFS
jgi:hypothetical protein